MPAIPCVVPTNVNRLIQEHLIGDGFPLVFDLERSHGSWIVDARDGEEYLDFYTFFASLPLGFRHSVFEKEENRTRLLEAALSKPANSDAHTCQLARFTKTFAEQAMPEGFHHLFFVEGGALAVENALKAAFDWKVRRNLAAGNGINGTNINGGGELGTKILHFREAFHGRSGYTMSLTNTSPIKTAYFPKFDWPCVRNPKLRFPVDAAETARVDADEQASFGEIAAAFARHPDDIAAIIIEPIQGEGGDNHFRREFLHGLRRLADEFGALLIFDEVQTGFGMTGTMWAFEQFDVVPDILVFGKKSQVCGITAGPRLDEVEDNVFQMSSRINSTWGGGLTDMVRCEMILEAMEEEQLVDNAARVGADLLAGLGSLSEQHPDLLSNVRGRGLFCAFDCPDGDVRDRLLTSCFEHHVLALSCGDRSIRMRPALTLTSEEAAEGVKRIGSALDTVTSGK